MSDVNIAISNDVIKGIIEQKLNAAVAAALGTEAGLLESLVDKALKSKVDYKGNQSTCSYENKYNLVEWLARDAIEKQARLAIQEWVADNNSKIKEAIKKQLNKQSTEIATSLLKGFADSAQNHYSTQIHIIPKQRD